MMFESAESEHPGLTNSEIISDVFQPYVITINQRYRQTDRQTDDMRSQYRALHYVHRAVKTKIEKTQDTKEDLAQEETAR